MTSPWAAPSLLWEVTTFSLSADLSGFVETDRGDERGIEAVLARVWPDHTARLQFEPGLVCRSSLTVVGAFAPVATGGEVCVGSFFRLVGGIRESGGADEGRVDSDVSGVFVPEVLRQMPH